MFDKLPSFVKSKYFIAFAAFFIWILFFDRYSLIYQIKLIANRNSLENQKEFFQKEITRDNLKLHELRTDIGVFGKIWPRGILDEKG
ncbi:MAG: hypothetical protein R2764_17775 [Bacteroidales bacterium]